MQPWLDRLVEAPDWLKIFILATSTLISEDLTTISAGIWVAQGSISPVVAVVGCFLGIFVGDGLLYLAGLVLGRPALKLPVLRNLLPEEKVHQCEDWFAKNGMMVVIVCRFIPGTRLPTYFAAGLLGSRAKYFLLASAVAVAVWTPLLVLLAWMFGEQLLSLMVFSEKYQIPVMITGILTMFLLLRLVMMFSDWKVRRRVKSRVHRIFRWEFWPILVLYFPVFFYNLWLMLRFRALTLPLLSNPGIDYSGFVGESKCRIMGAFEDQDPFFVRWIGIEPGPVEDRLSKLASWMASQSLSYPLILKPDMGQRGSGVRRIKSTEEAREYFGAYPALIQAQEFQPGPYEFGVYYVRLPNESNGRVLGLTGKEFPIAAGDGNQSLEELILRNPSGLGRIHIYMNRFRRSLERKLPAGEVIQLVNSGNHCLGTVFNDSTRLLTPELEARIDTISQSMPGFFIGRYDIRAENLEDFRKGRAFKIIELNGATGEPSHMYDHRHGLLFAYRSLFRHYRYLWEIGRQNARKGTPRMKLRTFLKGIRDYWRTAQAHPKVD